MRAWAWRAIAIAAFATILLGGAASARQQQTSFRETVDVIEFDVRVVNAKGEPILGLGADQFDVSINGARRRVVSSSLVRYSRDEPAPEPFAAPAPATTSAGPRQLSPMSSSGRIFVLVVDASTFDAATTAGVMQTARSFVGRLLPDDLVGLFVFPTGSQLNPSTDRGRVMNALDRISGTPAVTPGTEFGLRPAEVVALGPIVNDRSDRESDRIRMAICGNQPECNDRLRKEVHGLIADYEVHAVQSLNLLRTLIANLANIQGRKTLVMLSGGVVTSNRPGGRPDIGNLDILIGQDAVRTNTSIYTLFVDWQHMESSMASRRRGSRMLTPLSGDSTVLSRSLENFTGAAGGALFKALSGRGEVAFDRILSETSAYYVLGVEPATSDRDGKPRQLSVKVKTPGATVRGSRWVTVPQRQ